MGTLRIPAVILGLAVGITTLSLFLHKGGPPSAIDPNSTGESPGRRSQGELPAISHHSDRTGVGDVDQRTDKSALPESTPKLPGQLRGKLLDHLDQPIEGRTILCTQDPFDMEGQRKSAVTDELGNYSISGMAAGRWHTYLTESNPRLPRPVSRFMGEVEIEPDEVTIHDMHVLGSRQLSGNLQLSMSGENQSSGRVLFLELRSTTEPSLVVGRGSTITFDRSPWKSDGDDDSDPGRWNEPDGVQESESPPPYAMGEFSFSGLEPDHYELRIYLDPAKKADYIVREADLTLDDRRLGDEELTIQQFINELFLRDPSLFEPTDD